MSKRKIEDVETCVGNLKKLLKETLEAYQKSDKETALKKSNQIAIDFISLKRYNRDSQLENENLKSQTSQQKQKLDQLDLQLQNLLYEKNHLKKEILLCKEYKPTNKDIDLVPEKTFMENAPPELLQFNGEHQKQMNRLTYELQERKRLSDKVMELKEKKKTLIEANKTKIKFLESLKDRVAAIQKSTGPITAQYSYSTIGIKTNLNANYLPYPLYVLYYQISMYIEMYHQTDIDKKTDENSNNDLQLNIIGSIEDAIEINKKLPITNKNAEINNETDIYKTHPLSVVLTYTVPTNNSNSNSTKFTLKFDYLIILEIVAVGCTGSIISDNNTTTNNNNSNNGIIVNLFPNDNGKNTPNLTNWKVMEYKNKFEYEESISIRPFRWAQWICGLSFLTPPVTTNNYDLNKFENYDCKNIVTVMKQIKNRINTQINLQTQLESLNKLNIMASDYSVVFPAHVTTTIASWSEIKKNTGTSDIELQDFYKEKSKEWVKKSYYRYFKCTIKKDNLICNAIIEISPEYPYEAPQFKIKLVHSDVVPQLPSQIKEKSDPKTHNFLQQTNDTQQNSKLIEIELNANYEQLTENEEPDNMLLSLQLIKLQYCLDVYLQTVNHPDEFKRGITTVRPLKGRNRVPNYKQ